MRKNEVRHGHQGGQAGLFWHAVVKTYRAALAKTHTGLDKRLTTRFTQYCAQQSAAGLLMRPGPTTTQSGNKKARIPDFDKVPKASARQSVDTACGRLGNQATGRLVPVTRGFAPHALITCYLVAYKRTPGRQPGGKACGGLSTQATRSLAPHTLITCYLVPCQKDTGQTVRR